MGDSRAIIFTADDFGLHGCVNEAVDQAAREGVLSAASLMVAAPAAEQAIDMARNLPTLGVGLHLVLADGKSILPPTRLPDLVDAHGHFDDRMLGQSLKMAMCRRLRRQLQAELRAQFQAFADTGLALDHVNAHKHFHLHPFIAAEVVKLAHEFGAPAVRLPLEDMTLDPTEPAVMTEQVAAYGAALNLRRRLDRAGLGHNSRIRGLRHTGRMTQARMLAAIEAMPATGTLEIYSHPATTNNLAPSMAGYEHTGELQALISPQLREALDSRDLRPTRFADLV